MPMISCPMTRRVLSHNLLNLLTGILGNLDLLDRANLTPEQQSYLTNVSASSEALLKFAQCLIAQAQDTSFNASLSPPQPNQLGVLVVENDRAVQQVHCRLLQRFNYQVTVASNGYQALDLLNNTYDVVLLDLHMPGMDGLETARRVRQHPKQGHLPIIGVTTYLIEEVQATCEKAGFNAVIQKPLDPEVLQTLFKERVKQ